MYVVPTMRFFMRIWLACVLYLLPCVLWGQYTVSGDTIRSRGILSHRDTFRLCLTNGVAQSHHFYLATGQTCTGIQIDSNAQYIHSNLFNCRNGCGIISDTTPLIVAARPSGGTPTPHIKPINSANPQAKTYSTSLSQIHYQTQFYTAGTYDFQFTFFDCLGGNYVDTIHVTYIVQAAPTITTSVSYHNPSQTATIQAHCTANCNGIQYAWASGGSDTTLRVPATSNHSEIVRISNGGCTIYDTIPIIQQCRPFLSAWADIDSICAGNNMHLHATPNLASYRWSTGDLDSVISVIPIDTTVYTVYGEDMQRCLDTATVIVWALPKPVFSIAPSTGYSSTICAGQTVRLDAMCTSNCANANYVWSNGGTGTTQLFAGITNTSTVRATATLNSCTTIATTTITVSNTAPAVVLTASKDSICGSSSVSISVSNSASYSSFVWNTGATTPNITVSVADTFTVTATTASGCISVGSKIIRAGTIPVAILTATTDSVCNGVSSTIGISNSASYSSFVWNTSATTPSITTSTGGTYTVTATAASGCTNVASKTITSRNVPVPAFTIGSTGYLCAGSSLGLALTQSFSSYNWSSGANTATISVSTAATYSVIVTGSNGCTASASVSLTSSAVPAVTLASSVNTICSGQPVTFTVTATPTTGTTISSYVWSTGGTGSPLTTPLHTTGATTVTVTDSRGCTKSVSKTITVNASPTVTIASADTMCLGSAIGLTASATGGTSITYLWSNSATTSTTSVTPNAVGAYNVSVIANNNQSCKDTVSKSIFVRSCALPTMTSTADTLCGSGTTTLSVNFAPANPTFLWNTGATTQSITTGTLTRDTTFSVTVSGTGITTTTLQQRITILSTPLTLTASKLTLCNAADTVKLNTSYNYLTSAVQFFNNAGTIIAQRDASHRDTVRITTAGSYYARILSCPNIVSNIVTIGTTNLSASILEQPDSILCGSNDLATLITLSNCNTCSYAWSNGNINGTINVTTPNTYRVIVSDASTGCTATASTAIVSSTARVTAFTPPTVVLDGSSTINLNQYLTYTGNAPTGTFAGTGVTGATFSPTQAGVGIHNITFEYTENGCTFRLTANIQVISSTTSATFYNVNATGASSVYANTEACVSDTLLVTIGNFAFLPTHIEFNNGQGGYTATIPLLAVSFTNSNNRYTGTCRVVVPSTAKTGATRLSNASNMHNLGVIVINNPDVSITGIVSPACSNSSYLLTGAPSGGVFSAAYNSIFTSPAAAINNNTITFDNVSGYDTTNGRKVYIRYTYAPSYGTNTGRVCPSITKLDSINVWNMRLDTSLYYPIAVSETSTRLTTLLAQTTPTYNNTYSKTFAGMGVFDSVGVSYFNASAVGIGLRPVVLNITRGNCSNRDTGYINVIPAPSVNGLSSQYCNTSPNDSITRDLQYPYAVANNVVCEMSVQVTNHTPTQLTPQGSQPATQYYLFNPRQASVGQCVVTTIYTRVISIPASGNTPASTVSYIIGRASLPVQVGSATNVDIVTNNTMFCRSNAPATIQVTPGGGTLSIIRLNGTNNTPTTIPVASGATSSANIQTDLLRAANDTTTNARYRMVYSYGVAACTDTDTLLFRIPRPADATFTTQQRLPRSYCANSPVDILIANEANNASSSFFVNGLISPNKTFNPATANTANGGANIISHTIFNSDLCPSTYTDTFKVNALPIIAFNNQLPSSLCNYDSTRTISVTATPAGGTATFEVRRQYGQPFQITAPYPFMPNIVANNALPERFAFVYSYRDLNGCTKVDSIGTIVNPPPQVALAPLDSIYCVDNNLTVRLNPFPTPNSPASITSTCLNCGGTSSTNFSGLSNNGTPLFSPTIGGITEVITYRYQSPTTQCINEYKDTVSVNSSNNATLTLNVPNMQSYCFSNDTIMITADKNTAGIAQFYTSAPTPNNGGIIRQHTHLNGIDTAWFVPSQAVTGDITLSYSVQIGGCSKVTQRTITIRELPNLYIDYGALPTNIPAIEADTVLCESSRLPINVYDLNARTPLSPNGYNRYTYSGNGLVEQVSNFGQATLYIVPDSIPQQARSGYQVINISYTNSFGCRNTAKDSIRIELSPKPSIQNLASMYCKNSAPDTVSSLVLPNSQGTWICDANYMRYPTDSNTVSGFAILQFNLASNTQITKVPLTYKAIYTNGCSNRVTDTIFIYPPLALNIHVPPTVCNNSAPVSMRVTDATTGRDLTSSVTFGLSPAAPTTVFVQNTLFDPRALIPRPYQIIASYQNAASGCVDVDSQSITISAVPRVGIVFTNAINDAYCVGSGLQTISASNSMPSAPITYGNFSSLHGRLHISNVNASLISGTVLCDSINMDTIRYIAGAGSGSGMCYDTAYRVLQVVGLPTGLRFYNLDSIYCSGKIISTQASPAPNANANETGSIYIYPLGQTTPIHTESDNALNTLVDSFPLGAYRIAYNFKNYNNCSSSLSDTFEVHPSPIASFNQVGFCDHDNLILTSTSQFPTTFNRADTIRHYIWVYNNQAGSDSIATIYPIQRPGTYNANLTVTSGAGCVGSASRSIIINPYPRIGFNAVGGCQGTNVLFVADSTFLGVRDTITRAIWDFGNGVIDSTNNIQGNANVMPIQHTFQQAGVFYPVLTLTNNGYCTASDTVRLVISPSVRLFDTIGTPPRQWFEPETYTTDFEDPVMTDWFPADDSTRSEWKWGWAGTFNGASTEHFNSFDHVHEKVWTTSLGVSGANGVTTFPNFAGANNQSSWVYSPCFDFSHSHRPMVKFDYITELDGVDGVGIEYYDDATHQWQRLGEPERGVNWYNAQTVYSLYNAQMGVSSFNGWTNAKHKWKTARYRLDQFLGKQNVRFRVIFNATTPNNIRQKGGFAFDNFSITERQHSVLVEYFTHSSFTNAPRENARVYNLTHSDLNYKDIALIEYHGDLMPQTDPLYAPSSATQEGNNTRVGRYGIDALANGRARVNVDGIYWVGYADSLRDQVLDAKMLQDAFFHIKGIGDPKIRLDITNQTANLQFVVEAARTLPETAYFIFPTIVQDSISIPSIGTSHNVFRAFMHPDPLNAAAGMYYMRGWNAGDTVMVNCSWDYSAANIANLNPSQLKAVIFIQGAPYLDTVYQSVATNNFDVRVTPVTEATQAAEELFSLVLYPNPTTDVAFLSFDKPLVQDYTYQVYDMRGVALLSGIARQGSQQVELLTQDLAQGMYIVTMRDKDNSHYVQRKLIVSKP